MKRWRSLILHDGRQASKNTESSRQAFQAYRTVESVEPLVKGVENSRRETGNHTHTHEKCYIGFCSPTCMLMDLKEMCRAHGDAKAIRRHF